MTLVICTDIDFLDPFFHIKGEEGKENKRLYSLKPGGLKLPSSHVYLISQV